MIEKINTSIIINASKEKVWKTMLQKDTYEKWTNVFNPSGSTYEGDWTEGSRILFLGPDKEGKVVGGMVSRIKESRPFDFISIQHLGEIRDGKENLWPAETEAYENYTLNEKDGGVEVLIDLSGEFPEGMKAELEKAWPKALQALKELAEK